MRFPSGKSPTVRPLLNSVFYSMKVRKTFVDFHAAQDEGSSRLSSIVDEAMKVDAD